MSIYSGVQLSHTDIYPNEGVLLLFVVISFIVIFVVISIKNRNKKKN